MLVWKPSEPGTLIARLGPATGHVQFILSECKGPRFRLGRWELTFCFCGRITDAGEWGKWENTPIDHLSSRFYCNRECAIQESESIATALWLERCKAEPPTHDDPDKCPCCDNGFWDLLPNNPRTWRQCTFCKHVRIVKE